MAQTRAGNSRFQELAAGAQAGSSSGLELRDNNHAEKVEYSRPLPEIPQEQADTDEEELSGDDGEGNQGKTTATEANPGLRAATREQGVPPRSSPRPSSRERESNTASASQAIPETSKEYDTGPSGDISEDPEEEYGSPVDIGEFNREMQAAEDAENYEKKKKLQENPDAPIQSSKGGGLLSGIFGSSPKPLAKASIPSYENINKLHKHDTSTRAQKSNNVFYDEMAKLEGQVKAKSKHITILEGEVKNRDKKIKEHSGLIAAQRAEISQYNSSKRRVNDLEKTIATIQAAHRVEADKLRGNTEWWKGQASKWEQYGVSRNQDAQQLEGEIIKLKESLRVRNLEYMKLQDDLNEQKSKTRNTIASANLLQRVAENKEFFIGPQEVDATISNQFSALTLKVKTWSRKFQKKFIDFGKVNGLTPDQFRKVAPQWSGQDFSTRLNDVESGQKLRPLFVQGWIGLVLAEEIFRCLPSSNHAASNGRDIWLEDSIFESVKAIEQKLYHADRARVPLNDLNDWRAMTIVRLLASQDPELTKASIQKLSLNWALVVLSTSGWILDDVINDYAAGLSNIFVEAQKLNQLIRCQRASWQVRHPSRRVIAPIVVTEEDGTNRKHDPPREPWCLDFDPVSMKDQLQDYEGGRATVDMVLAPGLWKQGDVDGERFDVESCIVPSLVTLARQETNLGMET